MDPGPAVGRGDGGLTVRDAGDPLRAWRYWLVSPARRLQSVSQRWTEWPAGEPLRAACPGGHPAPADGCACGVYGAHDLEALRDHGLCVVPSVLVVGEVDLWGRVLLEEDGWRAQYGYPARLHLVPETVDDPARAAALTEALAAYGVPVATMPLADAVAGITAMMLQNQLMAARASRWR